MLASCSVPGLFPPVKLMTKDRLGHEKPYMASIRWVDGAIESDLPAQRLGELYNVNHHIVSQTNPHVLPFISDQTRKEGWQTFLRQVVKGEVKHRSKQLMELMSYGIDRGIFKTLLEGAIAVIDQQYYGDVTHPPDGSPARLPARTRRPVAGRVPGLGAGRRTRHLAEDRDDPRPDHHRADAGRLHHPAEETAHPPPWRGGTVEPLSPGQTGRMSHGPTRAARTAALQGEGPPMTGSRVCWACAPGPRR